MKNLKTIYLIILVSALFFQSLSCSNQKNDSEPNPVSNITPEAMSKDEDFKSFHISFGEINMLIQKALLNQKDEEIKNVFDKINMISKNTSSESDFIRIGIAMGLNEYDSNLFENHIMKQGEMLNRISKKFPKVFNMETNAKRKFIDEATLILRKNKIKNTRMLSCEAYANCVEDAQATMFWESAACGLSGPLWIACLGVTSSHYIYNHYVCEKRNNPGGACGHL